MDVIRSTLVGASATLTPIIGLSYLYTKNPAFQTDIGSIHTILPVLLLLYTVPYVLVKYKIDSVVKGGRLSLLITGAVLGILFASYGKYKYNLDERFNIPYLQGTIGYFAAFAIFYVFFYGFIIYEMEKHESLDEESEQGDISN